MKRKFCASVIAASMAVLVALSGWATEPFTAHASPFGGVQFGPSSGGGPAVLVSGATLVASGECGAEGPNVTWEFYDNGVLVISGTGEMKRYNSLESSPSKFLPPWISQGYGQSITDIVIEPGVTKIGFCAFKNCDALTTVTIPGSVTTIDYFAFEDCKALASITISEGVEHIGNSAFNGCVSLKDLKLPDSLVSMDIRAFGNCSGLETLVIPSCEIADGVFYGCDSLSTIYFDGMSVPKLFEEWDGYSAIKSFDGITATAYYRESDNWSEEDKESLSINANLTWVALDDDEFNSRAGVSPDGSEANPPSDNANGNNVQDNNNASSETGQIGSWQKNSIGWWWEYPDGTYPVSKWELINGKWYYFNSSGYMAIGWQKINGFWYYLGGANDGAMKTGWQLINGYWYYLGGANDGAMKTGWQFIDGHWYYLGGANDGAMKTGWQQVGGIWYFMYPNGEMASDTYIDNYYVDASGARVQNGSHGQNGGNTAGSGTSSGSNSSARPGGSSGLSGSSGPGSLSGTGSWVRSGNRWWYRHPDGGYTTNGWEFIDGKWYYFDAAGWMVTGWRQVNGLWYYMDQNGAMQTGWLQLKDTWYYLYDNGAMATDTWIGNDYVDASGAWVPDADVDTGVNANVFGSGTANSVVSGSGNW